MNNKESKKQMTSIAVNSATPSSETSPEFAARFVLGSHLAANGAESKCEEEAVASPSVMETTVIVDAGSTTRAMRDEADLNEKHEHKRCKHEEEETNIDYRKEWNGYDATSEERNERNGILEAKNTSGVETITTTQQQSILDEGSTTSEDGEENEVNSSPRMSPSSGSGTTTTVAEAMFSGGTDSLDEEFNISYLETLATVDLQTRLLRAQQELKRRIELKDLIRIANNEARHKLHKDRKALTDIKERISRVPTTNAKEQAGKALVIDRISAEIQLIKNNRIRCEQMKQKLEENQLREQNEFAARIERLEVQLREQKQAKESTLNILRDVEQNQNDRIVNELFGQIQEIKQAIELKNSQANAALIRDLRLNAQSVEFLRKVAEKQRANAQPIVAAKPSVVNHPHHNNNSGSSDDHHEHSEARRSASSSSIIRGPSSTRKNRLSHKYRDLSDEEKVQVLEEMTLYPPESDEESLIEVLDPGSDKTWTDFQKRVIRHVLILKHREVTNRIQNLETGSAVESPYKIVGQNKDGSCWYVDKSATKSESGVWTMDSHVPVFVLVVYPSNNEKSLRFRLKFFGRELFTSDRKYCEFISMDDARDVFFNLVGYLNIE